MKKLITAFAIATLSTLAACSTNTPAPNPGASPVSPDCGPKCQERIENHK